MLRCESLLTPTCCRAIAKPINFAGVQHGPLVAHPAALELVPSFCCPAIESDWLELATENDGLPNLKSLPQPR